MNLRVPAASLALALVAGFGFSCDDGLVHPFVAFSYDVAVGCLKSEEAIDILDGPAKEGCTELLCWVNTNGQFFVTDEACDAPADFRLSTTGPCRLALVAYKKRVICTEADAGSGGGGP